MHIHRLNRSPTTKMVTSLGSRIQDKKWSSGWTSATILEAGEGEDPAMLTHAVAASAWLSARLADWAQLAPDAGINTAAPARAMLVATNFHPDTVAMAEVLGADRLRLVQLAPATPRALPPAEAAPETRSSRAGSGPQMVRPEQSQATEPSRTSRFRTRLDPTDLGFTAP